MPLASYTSSHFQNEGSLNASGRGVGPTITANSIPNLLSTLSRKLSRRVSAMMDINVIKILSAPKEKFDQDESKRIHHIAKIVANLIMKGYGEMEQTTEPLAL